VTATESITLRLTTGDYKTSPAFILESADVVTKPGNGSVVTVGARRAGPVVRTQTDTKFATHLEGPVKREQASPMTTLLPPAIPIVASALPQQKDAVLAVHYMSVRDFVARPGYVLVTRGKVELPNEKSILETKQKNPPQAWRVDLMHCGTIVESYWFSDQRRLLRVDTFSGTSLIARRVATEAEARVTAVEKPKSYIPR
jgi:hypothetical protein